MQRRRASEAATGQFLVAGHWVGAAVTFLSSCAAEASGKLIGFPCFIEDIIVAFSELYAISAAARWSARTAGFAVAGMPRQSSESGKRRCAPFLRISAPAESSATTVGRIWFTPRAPGKRRVEGPGDRFSLGCPGVKPYSSPKRRNWNHHRRQTG